MILQVARQVRSTLHVQARSAPRVHAPVEVQGLQRGVQRAEGGEAGIAEEVAGAQAKCAQRRQPARGRQKCLRDARAILHLRRRRGGSLDIGGS